MKETKYFAYQMMAIGVVGTIAGTQNWVISLFSVMLLIFGMTRLQEQSKWFRVASTVGGIWILLILIGAATILPAVVASAMQIILSMLCLCMLCLALLEQMRVEIDGVWQEKVLVLAFVIDMVLSLCLLFQISFPDITAFQEILAWTSTVGVLARIGLILDLFRVQRCALTR